MDNLVLVRPSKELEKDIWEYRQEFLDFGHTNINGTCGIHRYQCFDKWLALVLSIEKDALWDGIHASTFFSVRKSDNKIMGSIQLRHSLTEELRQHGGHIGYAIRPSERKKGYGREQLLLVLDLARSMGMPDALISCYSANAASRRTATSCGGMLVYETDDTNDVEQFFKITLS